MKSSPIYNIINNPKRASDCSFGSDRFNQEIRVGTSSKNSHTLGTISVEMYHEDDGTTVFQLFLDGNLVRKGILDGKEFDLTKINK